MTVAPPPQPAGARGEPEPGMQSLQQKESGFCCGQSPARAGADTGDLRSLRTTQPLRQPLKSPSLEATGLRFPKSNTWC